MQVVDKSSATAEKQRVSYACLSIGWLIVRAITEHRPSRHTTYVRNDTALSKKITSFSCSTLVRRPLSTKYPRKFVQTS